MRKIATINVCEVAKVAADFVLDDFKDAYAAYERMSSGHTHVGENTAEGDAESVFEFVDKLIDANVAVVAFDNADAACKRAKKLKAGTAVYGIRFDQDVFPTQAGQELDLTCKQRDLNYKGLLLVGLEPTKVERYQGKPRLGLRRRKLSEATDRLIACVRAGISVQEAADVFGATKKQRAQAARNVIIVL